jgi:hypothetical protein
MEKREALTGHPVKWFWGLSSSPATQCSVWSDRAAKTIGEGRLAERFLYGHHELRAAQ